MLAAGTPSPDEKRAVVLIRWGRGGWFWGLGLSLALPGLAWARADTPPPNPGSSTAAPVPPTIGKTRSQRYCTVETERTNGAITVVLTNDKIVAAGIVRLRAANLDRPELTTIEREKSMHDLRAIAAAIQTNLRAGDAQVTDLRALAVKEPDAGRSAELKALADELDDAFTVQHSVGSDLAKMLTIVDGRYAGAQGGLSAAGVMGEPQQDHVSDGLPSIEQRAAHEPLNALFAEVADDFASRAVTIGKAEDAAATHVPKAVAGCPP